MTCVRNQTIPLPVAARGLIILTEMTLPSDAELHEIVKRVLRQTLTGEGANRGSESPKLVPAPEGRAQPAAATPPPAPAPAAASSKQTVADGVVANGVVAISADHGGFGLKQTLKAYLGELGYTVIDCGTDSTASVDYPDFAYAVAWMVSEGKAWRGIVVDGAGIGSCMVANKVPGVRAALCYDYATAVNSREHNDANVLTLGAGLIGEALARQIVKTWLATPFGGDRHARRVEKIMAIEKLFLKRKD